MLQCNRTSSPTRIKLYYGIAIYRSLSVHWVYIYTREKLGTWYRINEHWHSLDFINNNYCHVSNANVPLSAVSMRQSRIQPFRTSVGEIHGKVRNYWFVNLLIDDWTNIIQSKMKVLPRNNMMIKDNEKWFMQNLSWIQTSIAKWWVSN